MLNIRELETWMFGAGGRDSKFKDYATSDWLLAGYEFKIQEFKIGQMPNASCQMLNKC